MLQIDEQVKKEHAVDVLHVDISPETFREHAGLSPRGRARAQLQQEQSLRRLMLQRSPPSDYDDEPFGEEYNAESKNIQRLQDNSNHFQINGLAADRDVRGGARLRWEDVYEIMFQQNSTNGQKMALTMLIIVSLSVTVAVLDSVNAIQNQYGKYLLVLEVLFTIVFTLEYLLRVLCLRYPGRYALSLFGMIDLCALIATYLGLLIPTARPLIHLAVLRIFRVMRVFRILRLAQFVDASAALSENIQSNKRRIAVFLVALFSMILVIGCAMYLIEGDRHDFSNIPVSLYWAVVTITTVGYGDIAPQTILGRMLATIVMFSGYGIIACPLVLNSQGRTVDALVENVECVRCRRRMHQEDANFCRVCGTVLRSRSSRSKGQKSRIPLRLAKLQGANASPEMNARGATTSPGVASMISTAKSDMGLLHGELEHDPSSTPVHL